jgi:phosphoglucomutase
MSATPLLKDSGPLERYGTGTIHFAMARLDPDADRHGIVTPSSGPMNPNHYLSVSIRYLLTHRPGWNINSTVRKTVASSGIIDIVVLAVRRAQPQTPAIRWLCRGR